MANTNFPPWKFGAYCRQRLHPTVPRRRHRKRHRLPQDVFSVPSYWLWRQSSVGLYCPRTIRRGRQYIRLWPRRLPCCLLIHKLFLHGSKNARLALVHHLHLLSTNPVKSQCRPSCRLSRWQLGPFGWLSNWDICWYSSHRKIWLRCQGCWKSSW